jgi:hypothetical protein
MARSTRKRDSGRHSTQSAVAKNSSSQQGGEISDWLDLLSRPQQSEDVQQGWLTAEQIAEVWRVTTTRAQKKLRELFMRQAVDRQQFRLFIHNRFYNVFHYRIKN